jgi:hypothetical protein
MDMDFMAYVLVPFAFTRARRKHGSSRKGGLIAKRGAPDPGQPRIEYCSCMAIRRAGCAPQETIVRRSDCFYSSSSRCSSNNSNERPVTEYSRPKSKRSWPRMDG